MRDATDGVTAKPAKKPSIALTIVVLVVSVYLTVVAWTLCAHAMNVKSDIVPLLGMVGYPLSILAWVFVIRWTIRRHRNVNR